MTWQAKSIRPSHLELRDAATRAWEAEQRAAGMELERDGALAGRDDAEEGAREESAKRGVAWDMGKQHALTLMMESVSARRGSVAGMAGAATAAGFLGGGYALAAATGDAAPGLASLRGTAGSDRPSKYSGNSGNRYGLTLVTLSGSTRAVLSLKPPDASHQKCLR